MSEVKESKTFYRDDIEGLDKDDKDRMDTFAACLGFGPKYTPTPTPTRECSSCRQKNAYVKEIHPDTDMNEMVIFCPDCNHEQST
jgi:hypothetical protein